MIFRTSAAALCCSSASSRSRVSRTTLVSWPAGEELPRRAVGALLRFALRRRVLALSLLAVERRRIADPKAQDYADIPRALQHRFATGEMGANRHFAWQQCPGPNVRFGS